MASICAAAACMVVAVSAARAEETLPASRCSRSSRGPGVAGFTGSLAGGMSESRACHHPGRSPMKLYMHPVSTAARPVRLLIAENGIACEEELVDITTGAHHREPYSSLNPCRLVPMLDDDGFRLTESSAILKYLA